MVTIGYRVIGYRVQNKNILSETFENRICFQNLLLDPRMLSTDSRKILQDELRTFCLSSTYCNSNINETT
jgi:hypothetical protein